MQLIIELNESDFIKIIELTIKQLLNNNQYGRAGEAAEYIKSQTKIALIDHLRQFDFHSLVKEVSSICFNEIVEDTVRQEITRITKKTVKEIKEKGELLN